MPTDAKRPLQLNDQGQLRHFLSLDGLPRELLTEILDTADSFLEVGARAVKKVPLLLVVGKREADEGSVALRRLGSEERQQMLSLDAAAAMIAEEAIAPDMR